MDYKELDDQLSEAQRVLRDGHNDQLARAVATVRDITTIPALAGSSQVKALIERDGFSSVMHQVIDAMFRSIQPAGVANMITSEASQSMLALARALDLRR